MLKMVTSDMLWSIMTCTGVIVACLWLSGRWRIEWCFVLKLIKICWAIRRAFYGEYVQYLIWRLGYIRTRCRLLTNLYQIAKHFKINTCQIVKTQFRQIQATFGKSIPTFGPYDKPHWKYTIYIDHRTLTCVQVVYKPLEHQYHQSSHRKLCPILGCEIPQVFQKLILYHLK